MTESAAAVPAPTRTKHNPQATAFVRIIFSTSPNRNETHPYASRSGSFRLLAEGSVVCRGWIFSVKPVCSCGFQSHAFCIFSVAGFSQRSTVQIGSVSPGQTSSRRAGRSARKLTAGSAEPFTEHAHDFRLTRRTATVRPQRSARILRLASEDAQRHDWSSGSQCAMCVHLRRRPPSGARDHRVSMTSRI